jgi:hypothetical protein
MFGQEQAPPVNPFDPNSNPFNPVTEFARGGTVKKRREDMTDNEFIGMRRDDMPGSARKDLEALMAQIGQYAAGGMVPEYGYGGMVPEYAGGGMVPEYAEGGEVEGYAAGGQVPSYLGDEYNFAGSTIPGFYQLNAEQFPFWAMRNQQDGSVFTPGRPQFTPYNMNSPEVQGGVRMPNGRFLYAINQDTSTGYSRDPLAQEFLRRSYGPSSVPDKVVQKLKSLIKAIDPHPLVIDHRETAGKVTWIVETQGSFV